MGPLAHLNAFHVLVFDAPLLAHVAGAGRGNLIAEEARTPTYLTRAELRQGPTSRPSRTVALAAFARFAFSALRVLQLEAEWAHRARIGELAFRMFGQPPPARSRFGLPLLVVRRWAVGR